MVLVIVTGKLLSEDAVMDWSASPTVIAAGCVKVIVCAVSAAVTGKVMVITPAE